MSLSVRSVFPRDASLCLLLWAPAGMFLIFVPWVFIDFGLRFCCCFVFGPCDSLLFFSRALGFCILQLCLNKACLLLPFPASCVLSAFGFEPFCQFITITAFYSSYSTSYYFLGFFSAFWLLLTEQLKTWQETCSKGPQAETRIRGRCSEDKASVHVTLALPTGLNVTSILFDICLEFLSYGLKCAQGRGDLDLSHWPPNSSRFTLESWEISVMNLKKFP